MSEPVRPRFYGRRRSRRLRPRRRALLETLLPGLRLTPPSDGAPLDPAALFARPPADIWLEVGFGAGEHLAAQARAHPEVGFIGCEPFVDGVAALLAALDDAARAGAPIDNVRILDDDARPLLDALPDACLGRVFLLFSDPWPKRRHHRRRVIQRATLDSLARLMRPGAELRFASDHMGYVAWTLQHMLAHPAFEWTARRPADWRQRPADWPATRYQRKALAEGRVCVYLRFARRPA